jgi:hypothetical protein
MKDKLYSIIFNTAADFDEACKMIDYLDPDKTEADDLEMFWEDAWNHDHAVHTLELIGITVDTYTFSEKEGHSL